MDGSQGLRRDEEGAWFEEIFVHDAIAELSDYLIFGRAKPSSSPLERVLLEVSPFNSPKPLDSKLLARRGPMTRLRL